MSRISVKSFCTSFKPIWTPQSHINRFLLDNIYEMLWWFCSIYHLLVICIVKIKTYPTHLQIPLTIKPSIPTWLNIFILSPMRCIGWTQQGWMHDKIRKLIQHDRNPWALLVQCYVFRRWMSSSIMWRIHIYGIWWYVIITFMWWVSNGCLNWTVSLIINYETEGVFFS